jgi:hypothetical protein
MVVAVIVPMIHAVVITMIDAMLITMVTVNRVVMVRYLGLGNRHRANRNAGQNGDSKERFHLNPQF